MRGFSVIGLDNPKDPNNIGSVFRAAGCYGVNSVIVGGPRHYKLGNIKTDTQKFPRHTPVFTCEDVMEMIPYDCVPVAVDLIDSAVPLHTYKHPERAFYIFGAEDATLGKRITDRCKDVVYIPINFCMNLAATVNVVLYDRCVKRGFPE